MKKRFFALTLTLILCSSMIACGSNDNSATTPDVTKEESTDTSSNTRPDSHYDNSSLESIITGIETDFTTTIQYLQTSLEETKTITSETYEDYIENKQALNDWYALVLSEESELFERTKERAIEYFKLISSSIDHEDEDAIDDAMDEYYDKIYDSVMDDFYDNVYDDLMDDAYDTYYDGVVEDGYDVDPYEKWSMESGEAYEKWSDTSSSVYKSWSDTSSVLYRYWSAVSSGFYRDNFDIDAIIKECEKENTEPETESTKEPEESKSDTTSSDASAGIRPEFQEAMDSYEAFFDEYVDFMNEYLSADANDIIGMMDDYTNYMKQYSETMEKFEALESDDLSTEEALYYAEVSSRISAKLLEISY